jgi:hypothetical protein
MRWLPIILILCGFSISQAWYLSSVAEVLWETGVLCPPGRETPALSRSSGDMSAAHPERSKA